MEELSDIVLSYGQSDEFSFVLRKHSRLYERRARRVARCLALAAPRRLSLTPQQQQADQRGGVAVHVSLRHAVARPLWSRLPAAQRACLRRTRGALTWRACVASRSC